ncbi:GntR family transcriptional regulator [Staphylococcus agnetis]|nr:GntR family transcriptional regulator [Staphylococcus agnetis]
MGGCFVTQSQPKFLNIYNTLFEEIQMGKFPGGQALPTEKVLCERFGVSRMTLRQAIKILVEDGVIESIRGKGHIVIPQMRAHHASSVTLLEHPLHQMSRHAMTLGSLNYRVDLESEYTNHLFTDHPSAVIAMERYYFEKDNESNHADALCFTFIPVNVIDTFKINTQSERQMCQFVEETVYMNAYQSDLKYSITKAPIFKNHKHVFEGGPSCWLVVENVYGNHTSPILVNKWYLLQERFEIIVSRVRTDHTN